MRRTLIVIGAVVVIAGLAALAYFVFFRTSAPGITAGTGQNPFGEGQDVTGSSGQQTGTDGNAPAGTEVAPHFIKVTAGPVAYGVLARSVPKSVVSSVGTSTATTTKTVYTTEVRYAERESGNVFAYNFTDRTSNRLSNRTLPGIEEAAWSYDGTTALLRFLSPNSDGSESIDTYALPVATDTEGYFLEANLDQVIVTGTSTIVTLLPSSTGSIATAARIDGASPKTLFSSNLSSLRLYPAGKGFIAYTKASAQSDGYGFSISSAGAFTRLLGPLTGLTLLPSPSGKSVLYSYVSSGAVVAGVMDTATRATTPLPLAILPEKCVWTADESAVYCGVPRANAGTWPDSWYQGSASFSDRIWKVDMSARVAALVIDPVAVAGTEIDAVSLAIDPKSDVLFFTNKKDGSLWAFDL